MIELNRRAKRILQAVVQEYLQTGETVGSRTVTRRHGIELSPATVRNVMSDLEELGLLTQPHTSAGRVPTTEGLRFFIDSLLKVRALSAREKDEVRAAYGLDDAGVEQVLQKTSRVLAELSQQATIVIMPSPGRQTLEQVEFVRLRDGAVLAILVTTDGTVENKLIRVDRDLSAEFLRRASNYLSDLVRGQTLGQVRTRVVEELGQDKNVADEMTRQALVLGQAALVEDKEPSVIVSGQAHLLPGDAGQSMDRTRALLDALEEKERIVSLLDQTLRADGIRVWLGAESPFGELGDLSVIATPYGPEDRPLGTIAVIGPTRINYSRVIPLVDYTADLVTDILKPR